MHDKRSRATKRAGYLLGVSAFSTVPVVVGALTAAGLMKVGKAVLHDERPATDTERWYYGWSAVFFAVVMLTCLLLGLWQVRKARQS